MAVDEGTAVGEVSLTKSIARLILGAGPVSAAAKATLCLIDYLACALAAGDLPWCRQAVALAEVTSARPEQAATIIGTGVRTARADAVFANAVLGHGLVRDDMHLGSISHLGTVVFPVVLALSETRRVDGATFLAAVAAGYEAGGRLGRAVLDADVASVHRPTGITGPVAAAAAGARLLGLEEAAFANALGLAANTSAGFNEWAATGGSEMHFHPGFAARNGLTSLELAAQGAHVSDSALDGPAGLLAAFGKREGADAAQRETSRPEIDHVFFKEVPACNYAQTPAQAARDIAVRHSVEPRSIGAVTARITRQAALYPGCDAPGPFEHRLQAKMSIQYNVAAALATGDFDEANFDPRARPDIAALARRVRLEIDDELTARYPAGQGAHIFVELNGGHALDRRLDDVQRAPDKLVRARLVSAASARLGEAQCARLLDFIDAIGDQADCGAVGRLLAA